MRDITNTNDVREWTLDWFENRFSTTRECVAESNKLTDVCCFDSVDKFFLEYDAETDFLISVPEGCFDDCETLDSIVCKLKEIIKEAELASEQNDG